MINWKNAYYYNIHFMRLIDANLHGHAYYGFEQVHFSFQIKENLLKMLDVTNISNLNLWYCN